MDNIEPAFAIDKKKALLFGVFLLFYLWVNVTISLRLGLHWDEMADIDAGNTGEYVAAGRWGLALYRVMLGEGAFPLLAPVVGGVFICLALVRQTELLGLQSSRATLFYGGIYLSSIQWAHQLEYSHQCDAIALGILLATLGAGYISQRRCIIGTLLLVPAIGMYQSMALYAAALLLLLYLTTGEASPKMLIRPLVCLGLSIAGYFLLQSAALHLPWTGESAIHYQRAYQFEMSRWSEFPQSAELSDKLHFLGYYGIRYLKMTAKNMLGLAYDGQWVFASVLFPLGGLLWRCYRRGMRWNWVRALVLMLLWVLPFCLILITFSDQGARVSLAEPLVLAGMWGLHLKESRVSGKVWRVLALLLCLALLKSAYRVADIAVNEAYVYHSNLACVREMHTRGTALAESSGLDHATILLLGGVPFDPELTWTRQKCLGERGYIPPKILHHYCRFMHIENLRHATPQEAEKHRAAHESMPSWPASGSVRRAGECIIIRVD